MLAAARKYKRVVQVGTQRRSTPHLIEARDQIIKAGKLGKIGLRRDLLLLPHARARQSARRAAAARTSTTKCGPAPRRCGPTTSCVASAQLARLHGIRQRHRRRHVHPHARHGPLDARPRLAATRVAPPAASSSTRRARRTSPTRRPPRSTSTTCQVVWRTAPGATRPTRSIHGAPPFYGDKGTLKASVMSYDFIPQEAADSRSTRT